MEINKNVYFIQPVLVRVLKNTKSLQEKQINQLQQQTTIINSIEEFYINKMKFN